MIEFIKGKIAELTPLSVVLENNGFGYSLLISSETYNDLRGKETGEVFCHLQISNQENLVLFGFSTRQERDFFKKLTQVSGIGPKLAARALSQVSFKDFNQWILDGDEKSISGITGIGKKTSSKIIIEIKDKLVPLSQTGQKSSASGIFAEVSMALESLGFDAAKVEAAIKEIKKDSSGISLEEAIKKALLILNKR